MKYLHGTKSIVLTVGSVLVLALATLLPIATIAPTKASAATLPAYRYTKTFDTTGGLALGFAVTTDSSGNVYVTGQYNGTVIFDGVGGSDSHTALNGATGATFVTKYNANGTYGWTKVFDTTSGYSIGAVVAVNNNGEVYVTGTFDGDVTFDGVGGSDSKTSANDDSFLSSYEVFILPNAPTVPIVPGTPNTGLGSPTNYMPALIIVSLAIATDVLIFGVVKFPKHRQGLK